MKRTSAPIVALVAGTILAVSLWCHVARAGAPQIEPYGPSYFTFAGSDEDGYMNPSDSPNARARTGFLVPVTKEYQTIGNLLWRPEVAMEWYARRWPIGGESSPIGENNEYRPQAGVTLAWGDSLMLGPVEIEKFRVYWGHASNGQADSTYSASIDNVDMELYAQWKQWELMARGWFTLQTGGETDGIRDYINFKKFDNFGGEVQLTGRFEVATVQAILGLTSQDFYVQFPLKDFWSFSLLAWVHNGEADGIVDYGSNHVSWGGGISFFDL